jgi:ATP-dependent DNA helicase RecQ
MTPGPGTLEDALVRHWGYAAFRPPQREIIQAILAGRDVAAVLPTGGGKSLCYQLPAVLTQKTVVVISPLIALMRDQVQELTARGIPAAALNSSMPREEQRAVARAALQGGFRLLYLSPERLAAPGALAWLQRIPVALIAVDEAHCISEWGHEFRPEYRQLQPLRDAFPGVPAAAFTASATQRVRHDIVRQLRLREPVLFVRSFRRTNLRYSARVSDLAGQRRALLAGVRHYGAAPVIVYAGTVDAVNDTVVFLKSKGIAAVPYHARLSGAQRDRNQAKWMADEASVVVATLAFGMGIHKPDVRAVIHLTLPKSLEQYYQEAGRAGRDGAAADCTLLWQRRDTALIAHFLQEVADPGEQDRGWQRYHSMKRYAEASACRTRIICRYFGERAVFENCGMCDNCGNRPEWLA